MLDDHNGGVCAVGALATFTQPELLLSVTSLFNTAYLAAFWALARAIDNSDVVEWNNAPDQTAENVALGLEYAALLYEQEHPELAAPSAAESLVPCTRS